MEYGQIERTMYVDASPEVVFDVVSSPEHLEEWWPDDVAGLESPVAGSSGELKWGDCDAGGQAVAITVVDAQPPRLFSFRWTHQTGETAAVGNSMLVVFELTPRGPGTTVRMTETGFREMGWEVAVLEEQYNSHVEGWDRFLPQLVEYAGRVAAGR